jgi:hypothetical protein
MSIKKLITGLTLSMLLGSGAANADWGDVYYCQMTNSLGITVEGEMESYKPEKFQFKLDQTKNAMVYGSTGYFKDSMDELVIGASFPSQEMWFANGKYSMTYFEEGKFLYTFNSSTGVSVKSADCEKF